MFQCWKVSITLVWHGYFNNFFYIIDKRIKSFPVRRENIELGLDIALW